MKVMGITKKIRKLRRNGRTAVYYQTCDLLNVVLIYSGYIGGAAHGFYGDFSLLFDPKTGKKNPLENIFTD